MNRLDSVFLNSNRYKGRLFFSRPFFCVLLGGKCLVKHVSCVCISTECGAVGTVRGGFWYGMWFALRFVRYEAGFRTECGLQCGTRLVRQEAVFGTECVLRRIWYGRGRILVRNAVYSGIVFFEEDFFGTEYFFIYLYDHNT